MALQLGRLSVDRAFLESRVARRLFAVFVACSLIPVAAFAVFAYRAVRDQLDRDAADALHVTSKAAGMGILERLLLADDALRIEAGGHDAALAGASGFSALRPLRRVAELAGDDLRLAQLEPRVLDHLRRGHGHVLVGTVGTRARLELLRLRDPGDVAAGAWLAELDPVFVFAGERHPAGGRFWVRAPDGTLLHASTSDWQPPDPGEQGRVGTLSIDIAEEAHLVASWELFLASAFGAEGWSVFVSRPVSDVHGPLREFETLFPWIVGITLCTALGLSLAQIRRTLVPIGVLDQAARRMAGGDFRARAEVDARDEFATVADSFNEMAEIIGRQIEVLSTVNRIGASLSAERDRERLIELILDGVMETTQAEIGALFLLDDSGLELVRMQTVAAYSGAIGLLESALPRGPVERSLRGRASNRVRDLTSADEAERERWQPFERLLGRSASEYMTVPMRDERRENFGVLLLVRTGSGSFRGQQGSLAESLASQATVAIRKSQLVESFRSLFEGLIELTVSAIDQKSAYTGNHCRNVPIITELIADAVCVDHVGSFKDFELTADERYELRIAALLHDCGKVVTPAHVMDKATKLETIIDRIGLVETRFEVLRRDAVIRALVRGFAEAGLELPSPEDSGLASDLSQLEADLEFLRGCNVGGESMADANCDRVREIARRYSWADAAGGSRDALQPDEIRDLTIRRGTLNDAEREIIQHHVVATIQMLEQLPFPPELCRVPDIAGAHHERMDGRGYPKQLRGDQLSVQARILGLADVFEALTARDRPYKPGKKLSETLRILRAMSEEGHVDPELLELFLRERVHLRYASAHMSPDQIDPEFQAELEELTAPAEARH